MGKRPVASGKMDGVPGGKGRGGCGQCDSVERRAKKGLAGRSQARGTRWIEKILIFLILKRTLFVGGRLRGKRDGSPGGRWEP